MAAKASNHVSRDNQGLWHCTHAHCSKKFTLRENATRHLKIHDENAGLKCSKCAKKFKRRYQLQNHVCKLPNVYSCSRCEQEFPNKAKLAKHQSEHRVKRYSCFRCQKEFTTKSSLGKHEKEHRAEVKEKRALSLKNVVPRFPKQMPKTMKSLPPEFENESIVPIVPKNAPAELMDLIQRNWAWIKTKVERNKLYQHYNLRIGRLISINKALKDIFELQNGKPYKITIKGGFILEKRTQATDDNGFSTEGLEYQ